MTSTEAKTVCLLHTGKCLQCNKHGVIEVPASDYARYMRDLGKARQGEIIMPYVGDSFPTLKPSEREQIISGTHPKCWDDMFCTCDTTLEFEVHE